VQWDRKKAFSFIYPSCDYSNNLEKTGYGHFYKKRKYMNPRISSIFFLLVFGVSFCKNPHYIILNKNTYESPTPSTQWAIIGAGPAGIMTVGLLLDLGVAPSEITWVDPEFNVGRLGQHYHSVPSNTKTKLFVEFINACKTFQQCESPAIDALYSYNPEIEYPLSIIVEPLKDITDYLCHKVHTLKTQLTSLHFQDDAWQVGTQMIRFSAQRVVLATGSHPRSLDYSCEHEIPLDRALNKSLLAQEITDQDTVAVVGSSHSAILILKFLSELPVKRIINFYKNPLQYAIDMGDWVLHNSTGLKGITAQWAKEVLEKNPPANIIRLYNSQETLDAWLPLCNKIIYAVGYERNELPSINNATELTYDDTTGIIAPHLFGIGIAFPDKYVDPLGNVEHRVGLNSFMEYAQRVVPEWTTKESRARLAPFAQLFDIQLL
jgi:hypothetical protein